MLPHLEEYILRYPNRRLVLIEKRNTLAEAFLLSIANHWDNVIFMNNEIILMSSTSLKKILLISHINNKIVTNERLVYSIFSEYKLEETNQHFSMAIIFDCDFSSLSINLKIPQFINWHLNTISMCLDSISYIKDCIRKYNNNLISCQEIESSLLHLGISLKEKNKNLIDSFYEKYNNDFFKTDIL